MKTKFAVAAVLSVAAVVVSLADFGAVRSSRSAQMFLTEANGPSPGGHDTALADSSGPSPGGRDTALADSSGPSPGGHDTALAA